jgi:hypothetical protein
LVINWLPYFSHRKSHALKTDSQAGKSNFLFIIILQNANQTTAVVYTYTIIITAFNKIFQQHCVVKRSLLYSAQHGLDGRSTRDQKYVREKMYVKNKEVIHP